MNMKNLPEIQEAAADARVAAIYADIRATLGTSFVNLVYRHLATEPAVLEWAWQAVRPAIRAGTLAGQAQRLAAEVDAIRSGWGSVAAPASPLAEPAAVRALVAMYNSANAVNMMGLAHLLDRPSAVALDAGDAGDAAATVAIAATAATATDGNGDAPPIRATAPDPALSPLTAAPLPPLPSLDALGETERARIARLNAYAEAAPPAIVASLYRHLAVWPEALVYAEAVLAPLQARGLLTEGRRRTIAAAQRLAQEQPLAMPPAPPQLEARFGASLRELRDVTLAKMLPVGRTLAAGLDIAPNL
ncbi:MAG: hypothetical protein J0H09_06275 [Burkholderiales bacterium]|nr:hypothetical protein [Burkholderiales bacterium]